MMRAQQKMDEFGIVQQDTHGFMPSSGTGLMFCSVNCNMY
jgi:hypothetical protein